MAVSQLARDVAAFLTSKDPAITQALSRLDFSIDAIRLDPAGYRWMGKLMLAGGIDVTEAKGSGDSATAAVYTSLLDKMTLRPGLKLEGDGNSAILEQAGVVHETTHALVDFHGFATTNAVERPRVTWRRSPMPRRGPACTSAPIPRRRRFSPRRWTSS